MLETKILKYICHLNDSEYMADIVISPNVVNILINLLQSNDYLIISDTCLFIRDLVLACSGNDVCKQFCDTKLHSNIIPQLEHLVLTDNHFIRKQVIYTLGKICSYDSIPVLLHAFHKLRDQDPILLPRLVGELFWLGVDNRCNLIENMTASNLYTTRWAVLETLGEFLYNSPNEEDETFFMRYKFCNQLRHDLHPLVVAEAEYEYQILDLDYRKQKENISRSEFKKQIKELKQWKPMISFANIGVKFSSYIYNNSFQSYTIEELENFINT